MASAKFAKEHREPQPERDLIFEAARLREARDRREDRANEDDEHDGVRNCTRGRAVDKRLDAPRRCTRGIGEATRFLAV
jgi:hypothetical protein